MQIAYPFGEPESVGDSFLEVPEGGDRDSRGRVFKRNEEGFPKQSTLPGILASTKRHLAKIIRTVDSVHISLPSWFATEVGEAANAHSTPLRHVE